jgi:pimeloyl-ACP methyl ester carboxylesterase
VKVKIPVLALTMALAISGRAENSAGRRVDLGDYHVVLKCTGGPSGTTVILENGLGAGLETWDKVQSGVEKFARVCSYDRAGEGHSDKSTQPQSPDSVVADLHRLLEMEEIRGPYVLVGASLGGIYVRHFAWRYGNTVAGMVFADSSHEEQYAHYLAISPSIAERFATMDGRADRNEFLKRTGQLAPGKRLDWHLDVPLIVLEHKRLVGPAKTEEDQLALAWHELQVDLAGRSTYGKLIEANSGHFIPGEQPEIIVDSVREVIRQAEALKRGAEK